MTSLCGMGVQMSKEQELKLDSNRKKFDIREEYFVSDLLGLCVALIFTPV